MNSGWYMASTANIHSKYNGTMGVILSAGRYPATSGIYRRRLGEGVPWCLDNGVFSERFDKDYWIGKMNALLEYSRTCAFIVAPDVIGNCKATIDQFKYYRDFIINYPAAFVSQDGIINHAELIPWDSFDVLFVGGSDGHKLGTEGAWIIAEAKTRKKWVHVGRVNSVSRIIKFHRADSWDGTHLGFFPSDVKKFHAAVSYVRLLKKSNMLIGD